MLYSSITQLTHCPCSHAMRHSPDNLSLLVKRIHTHAAHKMLSDLVCTLIISLIPQTA